MSFKNSAKSITFGAFWSFINHVFTRGSLVFSSMIIGRWFDVKSFATFSYFNATVSMVSAFATLGLSVGASRFFAKINDKYSNDDSGKIVAIVVLSVVASVFAFFIIQVFIGDWFFAGFDIPKIYISLGVLILTLQGISSGALLGMENFKESAFVGILSSFVFLSTVFISVVNQALEISMLGYLLASLLQVFGNVYLIKKGFRSCAIRIRLFSCWSDFKFVLNFIGPIFLTSLLAASASWVVGRIILTVNDGEKQFSLVVIALQWFSLVILIPGMVSRVLLPRFIRINNASGVNKELRKLTAYGALATMLLASGLALGLILASPYILNAYGERYMANRELLAYFLLAAVISAPLNTIGNAIVSFGGQYQWLAMTCIWFLWLMALVYNFKSIGAIGVGISYAISYFLFLGMVLLFGKRKRII